LHARIKGFDKADLPPQLWQLSGLAQGEKIKTKKQGELGVEGFEALTIRHPSTPAAHTANSCEQRHQQVIEQ
jgi:hypothetical protein